MTAPENGAERPRKDAHTRNRPVASVVQLFDPGVLFEDGPAGPAGFYSAQLPGQLLVNPRAENVVAHHECYGQWYGRYVHCSPGRLIHAEYVWLSDFITFEEELDDIAVWVQDLRPVRRREAGWQEPEDGARLWLVRWDTRWRGQR